MTEARDPLAAALADLEVVAAQLRDNGYHDWPDIIDRSLGAIRRDAPATALDPAVLGAAFDSIVMALDAPVLTTQIWELVAAEYDWLARRSAG